MAAKHSIKVTVISVHGFEWSVDWWKTNIEITDDLERCRDLKRYYLEFYNGALASLPMVLMGTANTSNMQSKRNQLRSDLQLINIDGVPSVHLD